MATKRRARSMRSRRGMPAISSGKATLSTTLRHGKVDSSWNTMPIEACGPEIVSPPTATRPLIAAEQSADDVEQGRFAAARRSDHGQELAGRDLERHIVERREIALGRGKAHHDVVDDEDRRRRLRDRHHAIARRDSGHPWAIAGSISGARHRRGHGGGIAGLDADIDDGDLTGIDRGDGLSPERRQDRRAW